MRDLRVGQLMTRKVLAVAPDTSLETASRLLISKQVSGAPVVAGDGKVVGVVSLADLVDPDRQADDVPGLPIFYQISDGWASQHGVVEEVGLGRVADVMTHAVLTIDVDATLQEATADMLRNRVHRLIVTRDGALAGLVSTMDLLRGFLEQNESARSRTSGDANLLNLPTAKEDEAAAESYDGRLPELATGR